jgi:hypothetical protein
LEIYLVIYLEDKELALAPIVVQTYAITWKLRWNRQPVELKQKFGFPLWNPVKLVMEAELNLVHLLFHALPVTAMAK